MMKFNGTFYCKAVAITDSNCEKYTSSLNPDDYGVCL